MKKIWLLLIVISIGIVLLIYILRFINSGNPDISDKEADYCISANELFNEFNTNEIQANSRYLNKIVQINGKIGEVIYTQDNEMILVLKEKNDLSGINCKIFDKKIGKNHYLVGNSIEIRGIVQGFLDDVIVNNCVIINSDVK